MKTRIIAVQLNTLLLTAILTATGCSKQNPATASNPGSPEVKTTSPDLIEPNAGVGKLRKGMNKQQVEAAIGKPEKIDSSGAWWTYSNRYMTLFFDDSGVIKSIDCSSPFAGATKEGIRIGSTRAELVAAYGNPTGMDAASMESAYMVVYQPLHMNVFLISGKVSELIIKF